MNLPFVFFFFLIFTFVFWLCQVLVEARAISVEACRLFIVVHGHLSSCGGGLSLL